MNHRSSPRTPYEIRLELLQLSFEILSGQHQARAASEAKNRWESNTTQGVNIFVDTAPTTEQVIAEAEKMNTFVSKATQNQ
jgi:hypothetical protein